MKKTILFLLATILFATQALGGWWLISEQRTVSGETPTGGCMDGTYILAWDGDYGGTDGELELCHTSGAGTITGTNSGPLDLSTSHGESGSYGARNTTNDYNVDWTQTADQYLDMSGAQTLWLRVYIEGTPDNTLYIWESSAGSADAVGVYIGTTSYAGIYRANNVIASATGGAWTGSGWYDIGYSWDYPNDDHSFKNADGPWSTESHDELITDPTLGTDDVKLGNFTIWQTAATSTNGVRVDKFALVDGYQASNPWSPAQVYLVEEDFAGTTQPTDWTATNTPDYSTEGELAIDFNDWAITPEWTPTDTLYAAFKFNSGPLAGTGSATMFRYYDADDLGLGYALINVSDEFRAYHGTGNQTNQIELSANTDYWVWIEYSASTGAGDGVMTVRVGTNGTYLSSAIHAAVTTGSLEESPAYATLRQTSYDTTGDFVFDEVLISESPIGDF